MKDSILYFSNFVLFPAPLPTSTVSHIEEKEDKTFYICKYHHASHLWYDFQDESCKFCACPKYCRKEESCFTYHKRE